MSKIRTLSQLQNALDEDISWRIKEIANLKIVVRKSDNISSRTAIRASIPLLYAHWEGFIKNSATYYLEFVSNQGLNYENLASCFVVLGVKRNISQLVASKNSDVSIKSLDFIRSSLSKKAVLNIEGAIRTEFNLSSAVFENIASSIGIDTSSYKTKFNLIDESLLKRRNCIAHGEYLDVEMLGFNELANEVISLKRNFKTDIENYATLQKYKL